MKTDVEDIVTHHQDEHTHPSQDNPVNTGILHFDDTILPGKRSNALEPPKGPSVRANT